MSKKHELTVVETEPLAQVCIDGEGQFYEESIDDGPVIDVEVVVNDDIEKASPGERIKFYEQKRTHLQNKLAILEVARKSLKDDIKRIDEDIIACMREKKMPLLAEMMEWTEK